MSNTFSTADRDLKVAVDSLETALLTPIVSGDLSDWLDKLHDAWRALTDQLQEEFHRTRAQLFDEIAEQDPELLPRVEQLRAEEHAIAQQYTRVDQSLSRLADLGPKLEPDEERVKRLTQIVTDEGLSFVTRVRRQNVAVQTWYNEAFNRDRGPVD